MEKKAIFLGVTNMHSNKKNEDYRTVSFCVPPYKDARGFTVGGVQTVFTALDSELGRNIKVGSIVVPKYEYDPCRQRAELVDIEVVKETPYKKEDFE